GSRCVTDSTSSTARSRAATGRSSATTRSCGAPAATRSSSTPQPRIPLSDYTERELRYRSLANIDPGEAERLHALAEEAVVRRWDVYEEMATRGAGHFAADARKEQ